MTETLTQDLAANVRAEVARRQIRQAAIGEHLGIDQRAVSRRLTGRTAFTAAEVKQLAELLEVPVSTLYGETAAAS